MPACTATATGAAAPVFRATPCLVLDTNTVMALWFFLDPVLQPLRDWLAAAAPQLAARDDTLQELRLVLAYRQFGISPRHQEALYADYLTRVTQLPPSAPDAPELPKCRDRDDQKFLELARDCTADYLLTRDKAVLRLGRHRLVRDRFRILRPEGFQQLIALPGTAADASPATTAA